MNLIHRKVNKQRTKGVVLPIALVFLIVLNVGAITALRSTQLEEKVANNHKLNVEALMAAEIGVKDAISKLLSGSISDSGSVNDATWGAKSSVSGLGSSIGAAYSVQHYVLDGSVAKSSVGGQIMQISSTGTVGNVNKQVNEVISLIYDDIVSRYPLAACNGMSIGSSATTSSYSSSGASSTGDAGSAQTLDNSADISIASNANVNGDLTATGDVSIGANSSVDGDVSANGSVTTIGSATVTGSTTTAAGTPAANCDQLDVNAMITAASGLTFTAHPSHGGTTYNLPSNDMDTFNDGNYYFDAFSVESNAQVIIDGDAVFYINGDLSFLSNGGIKMTSGSSLVIYMTGSVSMSSLTCFNYTSGDCYNMDTTAGKPQDFRIYTSVASANSTDYQVDIASNSGLYGIVYAPNAAVSVNSNGTVNGAVQGKWVSVAANSHFVYDEDLATINEDLLNPIDYSFLYWNE